jgi:carbamoyltransferase
MKGKYGMYINCNGKNSSIKLVAEQKFPHSIGFLYSSFTQYLGFKVDSGEYKLMGLAPYGKPIFYDKIINNLVDIKSDGTFW